ncbi:MAG: primosomal protein N' [Rhodospirillales bacterium]|jgi:primosomal protein N' (replication factor Y)|nr:primosomal protein N' [Rhodospirillales bacterium]
MRVRGAKRPSPGDTRDHQRFSAGARVAVLVPLPLSAPYDYRIPDGMVLAEGDFVVVPLGPRKVAGVVWGEGLGDIAAGKLKDVRAHIPVPPMAESLGRFVTWVAGYTLQPLGSVLRMAMSVPAALAPPRAIVAYMRAEDVEGVRMTPARRRVLDVVADGPPRIPAELAREAGVSASVIRGLATAGALVARELLPRSPAPPDWRHPGPTLTDDQTAAADDLAAAVRIRRFGVTLLDGVPGSGKTEVYFHAIAEALAGGRQALVLLPEIALTAQWLARFHDRFGATPTEWHSELTGAERRDAWRSIADGRARVVVGARSALFLPFPELGLIVVDEEHDGAFKQEDGVIYNARDMAVVRARLEGLPVVLVSATPSLESAVNAWQGRYGALHLPDRHAEAPPPEVRSVDMRADGPGANTWLSHPLREALAECLADGEQAMLFLNRRGYAPLTICRTCGHRMGCPSCSAWLVEHRLVGRLQCHHCGYALPIPGRCPACDGEDTLAACGPGIERLAEEVRALHPDARIVLAASDTLTGPHAAAELVQRIEDHEIDLIIGTQIVAKGYHFPMLTLVGVIDADLGLAGGDLRAAERSFQILYQVAGRAGRGERPGKVLVQTYAPEHPVMEALIGGDRDRFLRAEADKRRDAGMPPFGRLAAIILSGRDEAAVDEAASRLRRVAPGGGGITVLGPAPAPLALLRGRHRRRFLLKARRDVAVQAPVRAWLSRAHLASSIRVQIDVDPYGFL